jgi:hypothetical protein
LVITADVKMACMIIINVELNKNIIVEKHRLIHFNVWVLGIVTTQKQLHLQYQNLINDT